MPFQKIQAEKLSSAVVRQIEKLILRGILRAGERLPPERELAETLGVSRPSLREAVADLHDKGLLTSRAGSGIYVADVLGSAFSDGLVRLFASDEEAVFDYLSFRRDMEGMAAQRAAISATDTDLRVIDAIFARMQGAHADDDPDSEAALDADFHMSIFEASHNVVLLHMMRSMFELLRKGVFYNRQVIFRQRTSRDTLLDQHARINAALQSREPARARAAAEAHIDFVRDCLRHEQAQNAHEKIALQRFEHTQAQG